MHAHICIVDSGEQVLFLPNRSRTVAQLAERGKARGDYRNNGQVAQALNVKDVQPLFRKLNSKLSVGFLLNIKANAR